MPVRFLQFDKHSTSPAGGVTNKSKTNEPRHLASTEQVLYPDPIDGTTAKSTTRQVSLI
jgi:hypothetical protein